MRKRTRDEYGRTTIGELEIGMPIVITEDLSGIEYFEPAQDHTKGDTGWIMDLDLDTDDEGMGFTDAAMVEWDDGTTSPWPAHSMKPNVGLGNILFDQDQRKRFNKWLETSNINSQNKSNEVTSMRKRENRVKKGIDWVARGREDSAEFMKTFPGLEEDPDGFADSVYEWYLQSDGDAEDIDSANMYSEGIEAGILRSRKQSLELKAALIVVAAATDKVIDSYVQNIKDYNISPAPDKTMEGFTRDKSPKVTGDDINKEYTDGLKSYPNKQGTDKDIAKSASMVDKIYGRYIIAKTAMSKKSAVEVDRVIKRAIDNLLGSRYEKEYAARISAIIGRTADAQGIELEEVSYEPDEEKMDRAKSRTKQRTSRKARATKKKRR